MNTSHLPSSPPVRAWEKRRDSETDSQYSLDLAKFDLDAQDDTDTRIPAQKVERVFSEDIDGPSDFTQNMDMWMRSGTLGRGTARTGKAKTSAQTIHEMHQEQKPTDQEANDLLKVVKNDGDHTGSHHTPENTPPKVSVLDNTAYEEQFSSEWQTDGEGSPPQPPNHRQFLQPTVEDYYSELSPARQVSQLSTRGRSFLASPNSAKKHSPGKEGQRSPGRGSDPTPSPVRSPVLQRTSTHGTYERELDHESRLEMEMQFKQLDAKCSQLEHLNAALGQALDEEKRIRKLEKSSHTLHATEAARREKDLMEMKELAHKHNDEFRREFSELKEKLLNKQKTAELARTESEGDEQKHASEVQKLRDQLDMQKTEHSMKLRELEQDLELARRSRDDVDESARLLKIDLQNERELHAAETARYRAELQEAHNDEHAIAEMERELLEARGEAERLKAARAEIEDELSSIKQQFAASKQTHEEDYTRASTERSRAVELATGLQRQLQELRQQLRDEQAARQSELEKLKANEKSASTTSTQEIEIIRSELESKQTELNMAILERDEAQDSLQTITTEKETLQTKLSDVESMNAALDARISSELRKREKHWRDKLEEANKERELMSKALLHQWGRQEVGVESPQKYAYKYITKRVADKENRSPERSKAKAKVSE